MNAHINVSKEPPNLTANGPRTVVIVDDNAEFRRSAQWW
jgi:hypothetical protein